MTRSTNGPIKDMIAEAMAEGRTFAGAVRYTRELSGQVGALDWVTEAAFEFAAEGFSRPCKTKEIRFTPSADRYTRWSQAAAEMGIPLTAWVQIMADGWVVSRPEAAPAPVQEPVEKKPVPERPEGGWLRERIAGVVGTEPFSKVLLSKIAAQLDVSENKVRTSLQSMINSGRATLNGDTYQIVKEN